MMGRLRWKALDAETLDELHFHLDAEAARNEANGMSPEEARAAARRAMGNLTIARHDARDASRWRWLDDLRHDLWYAARGLRRDRMLSLFIVLTLAVGLGATSAVVSLADRLFVRPPSGVVHPDAIRRLYLRTRWTVGGVLTVEPGTEYAAFAAIDSAIAPRARAAGYIAPDTTVLHAGGTTALVNDSYVTGDYFALLGVRPYRGRLIAPSDDRMGDAADSRVAVLSYPLWKRLFAGDTAVVGRTITLAHQPYVIIGVTDPEFSGVDVDRADVWLPIASRPVGRLSIPWYENWRTSRDVTALVRPRLGTSDAWLAAVATTVYRHGALAHEKIEPDSTAEVLTGPILASLGPGDASSGVAITERLLGVMVVVLLMACANVANLLLVRATKRRREVAIRLALGIRRRRLVRQLMFESLLLSAMAGAGALLVAVWGGEVLRAALLPSVHWAPVPLLDHRLLGFALGLTALVGAAAGWAPAVRASRPDLTDALKTGTHGSGNPKSRLRTALMVIQVTSSVLLLVGTGLFVRSLDHVRRIDLGYQMDRLVSGSVFWLDSTGTYIDYSGGAHRTELGAGLPQVAAALAHIPGVDATAVASSTPMRGYVMLPLTFEDGRPVPMLAQRDPAAISVSPGFFKTTGLRMLRGRAFRDTDTPHAPLVMIVDRTAAALYWPHADALGQCLRAFRATADCATVVGIADDPHVSDLIESPRVVLYFPITQMPLVGARTVLARAARGDREAVAADMRRALRTAFPTAEPPSIMTGAQELAEQYHPWEVGAILFSALGVLALMVAALGVYSVVAYSVSQRLPEMGIRLALGAQPRNVVTLVLGESLRVVLLGVALGVGGALAVGRLVQALLFDVSPRDPLALAASALLLIAIGVVASGFPAWRASRADPATTLRAE